MDEQNLNNSPEQPVNEDIAGGTLTFTDGVVGIFSGPTEPFTLMRSTPKKSRWLLPLLIVLIAGLLANFLRMRDEELVSKMQTIQSSKINEQIDDKVKKGEMTQEQGNTAKANAEKFANPKSAFFQIISYITVIIRTLIFNLLLTSLIALIVLKILKGDFTYTNVLNVIAFALLIAAAGEIISVVLSIVMGDFKTLSLGLVFTKASIGEKMYNFLNTIDVFTIWYTAALSLALAAIAKVKALPVFIIFLIYFIGMTALFTLAF